MDPRCFRDGGWVGGQQLDWEKGRGWGGYRLKKNEQTPSSLRMLSVFGALLIYYLVRLAKPSEVFPFFLPFKLLFFYLIICLFVFPHVSNPSHYLHPDYNLSPKYYTHTHTRLLTISLSEPCFENVLLEIISAGCSAPALLYILLSYCCFFLPGGGQIE